MFSNIVNVHPNGVANKAFVIINGPVNQATLRQGSDGLTQLSIAHQATNENPGFETVRSTVRFHKLFEIEETGKTAKGYVQFTMSFPKNVADQDAMAQLAAELVSFLTQTENSGATEDPDIGADALIAIPRLYAGEP
jgi:hypothetical protein